MQYTRRKSVDKAGRVNGNGIANKPINNDRNFFTTKDYNKVEMGADVNRITYSAEYNSAIENHAHIDK